MIATVCLAKREWCQVANRACQPGGHAGHRVDSAAL